MKGIVKHYKNVEKINTEILYVVNKQVKNKKNLTINDQLGSCLLSMNEYLSHNSYIRE